MLPNANRQGRAAAHAGGARAPRRERAARRGRLSPQRLARARRLRRRVPGLPQPELPRRRARRACSTCRPFGGAREATQAEARIGGARSARTCASSRGPHRAAVRRSTATRALRPSRIEARQIFDELDRREPGLAPRSLSSARASSRAHDALGHRRADVRRFLGRHGIEVDADAEAGGAGRGDVERFVEHRVDAAARELRPCKQPARRAARRRSFSSGS